MSKDLENAVIPYTKEVPVDYRVTTYSKFMTSYSASEYTEWTEECMSWKTTCMIGDWSELIKLRIKGPDVLEFFQSISGLSVKNYNPGKAKHVVCTNKKGKVIGEGILLRYSEDEFMLTGGPNLIFWADFKLRKSSFKSQAVVCSDDLFVFQVQGPNCLPILEKLIKENIRDIAYMNFREIEMCGAKVTFLRQGMSGNIGFELHGPSDKGVDVYNAILEAGKDLGIVRVGELSKGVNHVEACFPTPTWDFTPAIYDQDDEELVEFTSSLGFMAHFMKGYFSTKSQGSADRFTDDSIFSPVELGWSYSLCLDHEFPGCEILKEEKANPKRLVCTLEWNDEDVKDVHDSYFRDGEPYKYMIMPRQYEIAPDKVIKDGKTVGISMSRCYSIYFRKTISLCVLDVEFCTPGTEVIVIWGSPNQRQKEIRATVAQAPYYNPDKKRDLK